jgi:hypothetical protein
VRKNGSDGNGEEERKFSGERGDKRCNFVRIENNENRCS